MTYRLTGPAHFLTVDLNDSAHAAPLLDLLDDARACATIFVSGDAACSNADAIRNIARAGHEISVFAPPRSGDWNGFRATVRDAKAAVEDATGARVLGFRGGAGALGPRTPVGFEILAEEGFEYDSTCIPDRKTASWRNASVPGYPYSISCAAGALIEVPITCANVSESALGRLTLGGVRGVVSLSADRLFGTPPRNRLTIGSAMRWYSERHVSREGVTRLIRGFRFEAIGHRLHELSFGAPTTFAA